MAETEIDNNTKNNKIYRIVRLRIKTIKLFAFSVKKVKKSVDCRDFVRKCFIPRKKIVMMDNGGKIEVAYQGVKSKDYSKIAGIMIGLIHKQYPGVGGTLYVVGRNSHEYDVTIRGKKCIVKTGGDSDACIYFERCSVGVNGTSIVMCPEKVSSLFPDFFGQKEEKSQNVSPVKTQEDFGLPYLEEETDVLNGRPWKKWGMRS
jgi:hypothetical protein